MSAGLANFTEIPTCCKNRSGYWLNLGGERAHLSSAHDGEVATEEMARVVLGRRSRDGRCSRPGGWTGRAGTGPGYQHRARLHEKGAHPGEAARRTTEGFHPAGGLPARARALRPDHPGTHRD